MKPLFKKLLVALAVLGVCYGMGRVYYAVTGGFTIANISSNLEHDPRWETHLLSSREKQEIEKALNQEYLYLGKGCQSYVFASSDGNYVIKFFKFQRFRPQEWIDFFTFFPPIANYQQCKAVEKKKKLDAVFRSWMLAFDQLKDQTGVVFVHLNKSASWKQSLTIHDKMGRPHELQLENMEFLVQRKAAMLSDTIDTLMKDQHVVEAEQLIDHLFSMVLSEYASGYADNDHALMQNTGVIDGKPVHIDVGQLIYNPIVSERKVYTQEIYDKMYKFQLWLKKRYPILGWHLKTRLTALIGPDYYRMGPYVHKGDVAKIPHNEKFSFSR